MRKRLHVVLVCAALLLCACKPDSAKHDTTPSWLAEKMAASQREPVTNPPVVFLGYRYRGEDVVYRPPLCCDVQSVVYAASGQTLCHPDGGFTGKGDGRCPDFLDRATHCELLWRDPRAKGDGGDLCATRDAARRPLE